MQACRFYISSDSLRLPELIGVGEKTIYLILLQFLDALALAALRLDLSLSSRFHLFRVLPQKPLMVTNLGFAIALFHEDGDVDCDLANNSLESAPFGVVPASDSIAHPAAGAAANQDRKILFLFHRATPLGWATRERAIALDTISKDASSLFLSLTSKPAFETARAIAFNTRRRL